MLAVSALVQSVFGILQVSVIFTRLRIFCLKMTLIDLIEKSPNLLASLRRVSLDGGLFRLPFATRWLLLGPLLCVMFLLLWIFVQFARRHVPLSTCRLGS